MQPERAESLPWTSGRRQKLVSEEDSGCVGGTLVQLPSQHGGPGRSGAVWMTVDLVWHLRCLYGDRIPAEAEAAVAANGREGKAGNRQEGAEGPQGCSPS